MPTPFHHFLSPFHFTAAKMVEHHVLLFEGPGPLGAVWQAWLRVSCSELFWLFRRLLGRYRESNRFWPKTLLR